MMKAFVNAKIHPVGAPSIEKGTLLIDGATIVAVGANVDIPAGAEVIDCSGRVILPGFVDTHTHVGMWGESEGQASYDGNEGGNPITPHVRALDAINPRHISFADARMGGVTTVEVTPGSGNAIGGQMCVIKTAGNIIDEMILAPYNGMKAALGENVKNSYGNMRDIFPRTRMGIAAAIRGALYETKKYQEKRAKDPNAKIDLRWEPLIQVLDGKVPLRVHAHRADDIVTAVRLGEEFGIKIQIEHGTDAAAVADFLAEKQVPVNLGPSFWNRAKVETQAIAFETAGILEKAGVSVSLISDHPFFPIQYVSVAIAMAHAAGMSAAGALRAYTLGAAEHIGVADRVGSLEVGKDADFTIWDGCPFRIRSHILETYINGQVVYSRD
ncbi:MAG TPA: amidohydrolase [Firmicutes bacterium]|nr:amidohydrolase [Bacillota bacterium]